MFGLLRMMILSLALAFNAGSVLAQDFQKGLVAAQSGDYVTALQEWRPLAEQGYVSAQQNLGVMYENGWGVLQDYAEAVKWYRLAAEQGDVNSQKSVGLMYDNGRGVLQDYAKAMKWYRLAAEQGFADAQHNIGVMYEYGSGVLQHNVRAHMWYNIAAANGAEKAGEHRDGRASLMTSADISKAQSMAREWYGQQL